MFASLHDYKELEQRAFVGILAGNLYQEWLTSSFTKHSCLLAIAIPGNLSPAVEFFLAQVTLLDTPETQAMN